ncbi:MAG TPA: VIT1/CCC1 transporter family protein [Candidatus Nanoarchaeia archaeon]|nr:VIT1/CCC1 transporter family protein [Candidatus Nanoarchaeia archaeon]
MPKKPKKEKVNKEAVRKHIDEKLKEKQAKEPWHFTEGGFLREATFGISDGIVTTLALVAGVTGATTESKIIVVAGLAGTFASAISMGLGSYISTKSQQEFYRSEIARESREIEETPEQEKEELRELYRRKGFNKREIEMIVKRIGSDKKIMLKLMMDEELGLGSQSFESPVKNGLTIGIADLLAAMIPVLPFFFTAPATALAIAVALSMLVLFLTGVYKTKFTRKSWIKSGLETMMVGAIATIVSYWLGAFSSSFGV